MRQEIERIIHRGNIYYADLSPTIGSEQDGVRPVLIIQNDIGNRFSGTVIIAAVTGQTNKNQIPTHVMIDGSSCGLSKKSIVLLEQLRTIDCRRLSDYVGTIDPADMERVDRALTISVGLDQNFNDAAANKI